MSQSLTVSTDDLAALRSLATCVDGIRTEQAARREAAERDAAEIDALVAQVMAPKQPGLTSSQRPARLRLDARATWREMAGATPWIRTLSWPTGRVGG